MDHFADKLIITLESWLQIILAQELKSDQVEGLNEAIIWVNGWRSFINSNLQDEQIEEVFWLMFKLI